MGDELELEDDDVEITHCYIYLMPDGASLLADDDDNPTFLNGVPITAQQPLSEGDEIGLGRSRLVVTRLIPTGQREHEVRYTSIKLLDQCPHCGDGLPINGLVDELTCDACSQTVSPGDNYWKSILEDLDNDYYSGGSSHTINFRTRVRWKAEKPKCTECDAELAVDDIAEGFDGDVTCTSCGAANATYPAGERFRGIIPSLKQVFGGERSGVGDAMATDGVGPVVLACPQCQAPLQVGADSKRMVPCGHCGAEVMLPDELWRRIHPSATARKWYMSFQGPSLKELEEIAERPKKLAEAQERIDLQRSVRRSEAAGKRSSKVGLIIGIAVPVSVVVLFLLTSVLSGTGGPGGSTNLQPVTQPLTYSGTVSWASGHAPVQFGTPCMVSVVPNPSFPNSPFNCHIRVQCGAATLYGWQDYGYTECQVQAGTPVSAHDPRGTAQEGDPMLELNVPQRMVRIYDNDPGRTYEVRVAW
jgi:hypothetical protein